MIKSLLLVVLAVSSGCALSGGDHSEFYTWVDASGQLRTEQITKAPEASIDGADNGNVEPTIKTNDFDPKDFMPSEQVDVKISDGRLFAWQDEAGKQSVQEVKASDIHIKQESLGQTVETQESQSRLFDGQCCEKLSASEKYPLNDLAGRQLKLTDYYHYEDALSSDALILDLVNNEIGNLRIKTFIQKGKLALPDIILLNERFKIKSVLTTPFTHFVEESWSTYGYMQGRITKDRLVDVAYLVILPSKQVGILELGAKQTKITDLGSIVVQRDASNP